MIKGIRIRIYPNKTQMKLIENTFGCCRLIYNKGLAMRKDAYDNLRKTIGYKETSSMLTDLKKDESFDFLKEVDSVALQQSLRDLDKAYKNFFRTKKGFPKFKSKKKRDDSYRTQNSNNSICIAPDNKHIKLPKLKQVKAKISYDLSSAKINNATIERTPSNKYFVVLNVDIPVEPKTNAGGLIGIDLGIKNLYTDSNGHKCENGKWFHKSLKKLVKLYKKLAKMTKLQTCGKGKNIQKQRLKIARLREHIVNQRNDYLQKESTRLVSENQVIGLEDLEVNKMFKNLKLSKSTLDVSWTKFIEMLEYKAPLYGSEVIKVPRYFESSQICNCCGFKNSEVKDLGIRDWICPRCGAEHDRDINASKNILNKALEIRAQRIAG